MAEYRKGTRYKKMAQTIIKNTLPHLEDVRIDFLISDEEKKKNTKLILGTCYKVKEMYQVYCPYDFIIVIYEMNCLNFTLSQYQTLVEHELRHCGIDDEGDERKFYCVPHDYEEFEDIINRVGLKWAEGGED